jgi:hypothetical protein
VCPSAPESCKDPTISCGEAGRICHVAHLQGCSPKCRLVALDEAGHRFADAVMDKFSDWFREMVKENTVAGRTQKAREGKLIRSGIPIYGFEYTTDGESFKVVPEHMGMSIGSCPRCRTVHPHWPLSVDSNMMVFPRRLVPSCGAAARFETSWERMLTGPCPTPSYPRC